MMRCDVMQLAITLEGNYFFLHFIENATELDGLRYYYKFKLLHRSCNFSASSVLLNLIASCLTSSINCLLTQDGPYNPSSIFHNVVWHFPGRLTSLYINCRALLFLSRILRSSSSVSFF